MNDSLATVVADYLAHKRALGRKFNTEEATLRLLLAFADQHDVHGVGQLSSDVLDAFVASRPRKRARSFNHLVGIVCCFLEWAVAQQRLQASPLRRTRRHETDLRLPFLFDIAQARRLLDAAAALPDNSRAVGRGPTYHAIFALCYGLGLRVGEACGLLIGDVDAEQQLLTVRGGKFGKTRLAPHGPRIGELLARQVERRHATDDDPLFTFDRRRNIHPCSASQVFHHLMADLAFPVPDGVSPPRLHCLRHSFAVDVWLAGIARVSLHRSGSTSSLRLWVTSTQHPRQST